MVDVSFVKEIADIHCVFIKFDQSKKQYLPQLQELVKEGLLIKNFPNLIITRKLKEMIDKIK